MPVALTVDLGWPWWMVTTIGAAVTVACLAALFVSRNPAARAVAAVLAVEGAVIAVGAPFVMDRDSSSSTSAVIHVVEHAPPPNMRMVGGVLTFANPIFDGRDVNRIGRDQGFCLDIALAKSSECVQTTLLAAGRITTEGPVSDTETSFIAVTGGTGRYQDARGWAEEKAHNKAGTKFDITFHLSG